MRVKKIRLSVFLFNFECVFPPFNGKATCCVFYQECLSSSRRQQMTPCEAELMLSGYEKIKSAPSNYWLGHTIKRTNHIFTGGLPQQYFPSQVNFIIPVCNHQNYKVQSQFKIAFCKTKKLSFLACYLFIFSKKAEPFHNYTGCIEIIEVNNLRSFSTFDAIAGSNIDRCR